MDKKILSLACIALTALLSGCVVGQSIKTDYKPTAVTNVGGGSAIALEVADNRPYVKNGEKQPFYIGKYRAGFGNPWDVSTEGKVPLADIVKKDLGAEVTSLGFGLSEAAAADRRLSVSINEWNFDGYQNGKFWYVIDVRVLGNNGTVLANSQLNDSRVIKGSLLTGAKGGFEKEMPGLHAEIIRKIARENPPVMQALAGH